MLRHCVGHSFCNFCFGRCRSLTKKQNFAACGKNNILRLFLSSRSRPAVSRSIQSIFKNAKRTLKASFLRFNGGAKEDRTPDLLNAIQALSQLSYNPKIIPFFFTLQLLGHSFRNFCCSRYRALTKKRNFAACGKNNILRLFLSSRPTEL